MADIEQLKVCEHQFDSIEDKIKTVHSRIDEFKALTYEIGNIEKILIEFQFLIRQQQEDSNKRDDLIKELYEQLKELTNNQLKIGLTLDNLADKSKLTDINVEALNRKIDALMESNTISIIEALKKLAFLGLGVGGTLGFTKLFN